MSQLASTLTTVQTALSQLERNINPRLLCEVLFARMAVPKRGT